MTMSDETMRTDFRLERDAFGRLVLTDARGVRHEGVVPVRAFPLSAPGEGLSLVGADGRERLWIDRADALPAALREVLGDHVKQQGSLVGPDRLRFDFSHFEPVSAEQIREIEDLANHEILDNAPVRHFETTKDEAAALGAIAFFGEKYGDVVRVLEAGRHSTELCGGTHVKALGDIGPLKVVSEGSIGSNLRRMEAITGTGPIDRLRDETRQSMAARAPFQPPLIDRLDEYPEGGVDLARIVELPPKLASIAAKPIFLDVAWNHVHYPRPEGPAAAAKPLAASGAAEAGGRSETPPPARAGRRGCCATSRPRVSSRRSGRRPDTASTACAS